MGSCSSIQTTSIQCQLPVRNCAEFWDAMKSKGSQGPQGVPRLVEDKDNGCIKKAKW